MKKKRRFNAKTVMRRILSSLDKLLNKISVNSKNNSRKPEERLKRRRNELVKLRN